MFSLYVFGVDCIILLFTAAKEREKAQKRAIGLASASSSRPPSVMNTPTKKKSGPASKKSGSSTPIRGLSIDQRQLDLSGLNLTRDDSADNVDEPPPKITFAREKLLEEAKRAISAEGENQKKAVSLVVIGKHLLCTVTHPVANMQNRSC